MKTPICLITVTALTFALFVGCSKAPQAQAPQFDDVSDTDAPFELKTDAQTNGYAMGIDNAEKLRDQLKDIVDMKALARGFSDELHERNPKKVEIQEIRATLELMRKKVFEKANVEVDSKKAGYCIGLDHGSAVKQKTGPDVDLKALAQGFADELAGRQKKMSKGDIGLVVKAQGMKQIDQMMAEGAKAQAEKKGPQAAKNLAEAETFLEENAKKEGVKTTASGLQYMVLQEGNGAQPKATDKVTVHYEGTLLNGTVFDSSYKRKEPITFALDQVIKGWTEGLQLMKAGSKYKFFIPSELGYGEGGSGANIGPNAALIFEVELLKVN